MSIVIRTAMPVIRRILIGMFVWNSSRKTVSVIRCVIVENHAKLTTDSQWYTDIPALSWDKPPIIIDMPVMTCWSLKLTIVALSAEAQRSRFGVLFADVDLLWSIIALVMQQNNAPYAVKMKPNSTYITSLSVCTYGERGRSYSNSRNVWIRL